MQLYNAMKEANEAGRMGLILYTIPNFPDPVTSDQVRTLLIDMPFVSMIETTFPVDSSFSGHANETIISAHQQAVRYERDYEAVLEHYVIPKASLCVLYKKTVDDHGFENVVRKMSGRIDGIILEWNENDHVPYYQTAQKYGVELVQSIGPWMSDEEIRGTLNYTKQFGLVYLMSASMTGANLLSQAELEHTIVVAKQARSDIKIAAGFGVKTAEDVRRLSKTAGLDAVIIGTQFLKTVASGITAVRDYLSTIEKELSRG